MDNAADDQNSSWRARVSVINHFRAAESKDATWCPCAAVVSYTVVIRWQPKQCVYFPSNTTLESSQVVKRPTNSIMQGKQWILKRDRAERDIGNTEQLTAYISLEVI